MGDADQTPTIEKLLQNLKTDRAFLLGCGFVSGLVIGTGLAILLTRRPRA